MNARPGEKRRRRPRNGAFALFAAAGIGYLALSPAAGPALLRLLLPRLLRGDVSAEGISGTLAGGISLRGLEIRNLGNPARPLTFRARSAVFNPLNRFRSPAPVLRAEEIRIVLPGGEASVAEVVSRTGTDLSLRGMALAPVPRLPPRSALTIPECRFRFSFFSSLRESHSLEFAAARLSLPLSLFVFAGSSCDRRLDLQVFPSRLHLMDLAYLLPVWRAVQPDGILAVEGAVKGTWEQPEVSAFARWTEAVVGNLRLRNGEAEGEATVYPRGVGTTLTGFLRVVSGKVEVGGNSLAIKSARIFYLNRAVLDPDINLLIEGRIGERLVTIAGEGTIAHPRIRLRSRPPLPEEEIFELLAAPPFAAKQPFPQPAARTSAQQLVDRLLLEVGGSATPSRRSWELAEVVYDPEKGKTGATVRASWTDRFSALYGLALRPSGIDQVLGVEYRLLDSLTIGQQQGFRLDGEAPIDVGGESKFYLRWKREF